MSAAEAAPQEAPPGPAAANDHQEDSNDDTNDDTNASIHLQFLSEEDTSRTLPQHHPDRMRLTQREYERALAIKAAVEQVAELDPVSDFLYAQLAIVGLHMEETLDQALDRCHGLQAFREEYLVQNTYAQGARHLAKLFEWYPQQFLWFNFSAGDGCYVFGHDMSQFDPKLLTTHYMYQEWTRGRYYCHLLFHPDLESVRKGFICLMECQDVTLRRDVMKLDKAFFEEFLQHYPFWGQARQFHTSMFANVAWSVLKKMLPKKIGDNFQVGLQWEGGHLGRALLKPTVEEANARTLTNMKEALKLRLANEESFSLDHFTDSSSHAVAIAG